jgi:transcriptional regulator with XRE-family HTH domain
MLTQGEDVEAYALRARGWSISAIARHLGRDRKTIAAYLNGERAPGRRVRPMPDSFEPFAEYCRLRLDAETGEFQAPCPPGIAIADANGNLRPFSELLKQGDRGLAAFERWATANGMGGTDDLSVYAGGIGDRISVSEATRKRSWSGRQRHYPRPQDGLSPKDPWKQGQSASPYKIYWPETGSNYPA